MANWNDCLKDAGVTPSQLGFTKKQLDDGEVSVDLLNLAIAARKASDAKAAIDKIRNAEILGGLHTRMQQGLDNGMKPQQVVLAVAVRDARDRAKNMNINDLSAGYQNIINQPLAEAAEALKPTITGGVRNADILKDAVAMMNGQAAPKLTQVQDVVLAIYKGMREASDTASRLYRDAGGELGHVDNWFPQTHSAKQVASGGRKMNGEVAVKGIAGDEARVSWKNYITSRLDRTKMVDEAGNALDDAALDKMLDASFQTIITEGRIKTAAVPDLTAETGGRRTFAQRQDLSRKLHFKDADGWMQYHEKYGEGELWGNFTVSMQNMGTDIAILKVLGTDAMNNWRSISKWATTQDPSLQVVDLDAVWNNLIGFDVVDNMASQVFSAGRNIVSGAWMGSAAVASIPDGGTMFLTASMNDLNIPRMLTGLLRLDTAADREVLARTAGYIEWALSGVSQNLRMEENLGNGVARRLSDANYRVGGMHAMQNKLRAVFLREMLGKFALERGKPLDEVTPGFRGTLETYGLADRWDDIRAASLIEEGTRFEMMDVSSITDMDLQARVLGAIQGERDMAILTPDARVRALINQGRKPGSLGGEVLRSMTQFMTYPATMLMLGVTRYASSARLSNTQRAGYMASSVALMTILGGVSYQLRELSKGREMRDMNTLEFYLQSMAYGGAVPGMAELLMEGQTRHGRSAGETAFGPLGAVVGDTYRGSFGAAFDYLQTGDKEKALETLGRGLEGLSRNIPGQSLWWGRAFAQRVLRDNMMSMMDPSYAKRQADKADWLNARTGQDEFWQYGEGAIGDLNMPF